jgi:post-segregation antitoxin (ccd killing protein)
MGKRIRVNLTIDEDIVEKAKTIGLNLSKTCENCLIRSIKALETTYGENNNGNSHENSIKRVEWAEPDLNQRSSPRQGDILTS